jgi:RimJ/RimL family protein N-acetyltransferase
MQRLLKTVVGDATLTLVSQQHRQVELGGTFHPAHQSRGLATETGEALLTIAFEGLGAERVVGRCHTENRPSAALCERLGMRREGHFRHSLLFKGAWADEYIFALLAAEWQARRSG